MGHEKFHKKLLQQPENCQYYNADQPLDFMVRPPPLTAASATCQSEEASVALAGQRTGEERLFSRICAIRGGKEQCRR